MGRSRIASTSCSHVNWLILKRGRNGHNWLTVDSLFHSRSQRSVWTCPLCDIRYVIHFLHSDRGIHNLCKEGIMVTIKFYKIMYHQPKNLFLGQLGYYFRTKWQLLKFLPKLDCSFVVESLWNILQEMYVWSKRLIHSRRDAPIFQSISR